MHMVFFTQGAVKYQVLNRDWVINGDCKMQLIMISQCCFFVMLQSGHCRENSFKHCICFQNSNSLFLFHGICFIVCCMYGC